MKDERNTPYTIDTIKDYIIENDMQMTLISDRYIDNKSPLNFQCDVCEHTFTKSLNSITSKGQSCPACGKNGERITKPQMREIVSRYGYEIIKFTRGDSNKGTLFEVKCDRNHIYEISYRAFIREEKSGGSCKECCKEGYHNTKKKSIKRFHDLIKTHNYRYIGDEITKHTDRRTFICENGHERDISFHTFERHPNCLACTGSPNKLSETDLQIKFNKLGMEYIGGFVSTTSDSIIIFRCKCGGFGQGRYRTIIKSKRCNDCLTKKDGSLKV